MFLHSSRVSSGLSDSLLRNAAPYYNSFLSLSPPQLEWCSWSAEVWMETHIYIRGTCRDCSLAGHNPIGPGCSACKSCVRKESSQDSWEAFCKFDSRGGSSSQECYGPPCLCGKKAGCHKFSFVSCTNDSQVCVCVWEWLKLLKFLWKGRRSLCLLHTGCLNLKDQTNVNNNLQKGQINPTWMSLLQYLGKHKTKKSSDK